MTSNMYLKYIKYIFHLNVLYVPFNEIKEDTIKRYLAEYQYFIYTAISNELKQAASNYTISIGLGDFPNFCWDPLYKEFIVIVSNKNVTKELHFWQLCKSMIYYFYPNYFKCNILKFPFIADVFTAVKVNAIR